MEMTQDVHLNRIRELLQFQHVPQTFGTHICQTLTFIIVIF